MTETYTITHYTENGKDIFGNWHRKLRDIHAKIAIDRAIINAENGNLGVHHFCRDGVWELVINYGPGYRVYVFRCWQNYPVTALRRRQTYTAKRY